MSIELKIEALTAAITALTATIAAYGTGAQRPLVSDVVYPAPVAPPAPALAPVVVSQPVPVAPAPVVALAPVVAAAPAPFADAKGLIQYVMDVYRAVGPAKGQEIQAILSGMGYANINDVRVEHYAEFHGKVEALR
jgi:hypothetical protein